jgi:hypothetical protein
MFAYIFLFALILFYFRLLRVECNLIRFQQGLAFFRISGPRIFHEASVLMSKSLLYLCNISPSYPVLSIILHYHETLVQDSFIYAGILTE